MKLEVGQTIPNFTYNTPYQSGLELNDTLKQASNTALVFLRYYGCTLCQLSIHQYKEQYEAMKQAGGQLLVVLQSDPVALKEELGCADALPFEVICDPSCQLYQQFEIKPAPDKDHVISANFFEKKKEMDALGFKHGRYEGEELQLPADFILDSNGTILHAHYADVIDDVPSMDDLVKQF